MKSGVLLWTVGLLTVSAVTLAAQHEEVFLTLDEKCPPSSPVVRCAYGPPVSCNLGDEDNTVCWYYNECMARSTKTFGSTVFDTVCTIHEDLGN
jgi:hypothetical protein